MTIDIEVIEKQGLTIKEFLSLKCLYHKKIGDFPNYVKVYGDLAIHELLDAESAGFIKIPDHKKIFNYELRDKIRMIFEGKKDLFLTFLSTFPLKTPSGRYLCTKDADTVAGKKLRIRWDKHFKNDVAKQRKALSVLEAEMAWRVRNNSLEYMNAAEAWLNQGNYQKYEHLLEKNKITREDYL